MAVSPAADARAAPASANLLTAPPSSRTRSSSAGIKDQAGALSRLKSIGAATSEFLGVGKAGSRVPYQVLVGGIGASAGYVAINAIAIYFPPLAIYQLIIGVPVLSGLLGAWISRSPQQIQNEQKAAANVAEDRVYHDEEIAQITEIEKLQLTADSKRKLKDAVIDRRRKRLALPAPTVIPTSDINAEKSDVAVAEAPRAEAKAEAEV
jgi:hypothetical protein